MSHIAFTYHIVFGTYRRIPAIVEKHEKELYKYMYTFLTERDIYVRRIGGMPDHIHILCDIPPKYAVADIMKMLKIESSKFMKVNRNFPLWSGWAEGYAGFTVDTSLRDVRKQYIMNQKEHHAKQSFADELRQLLIENGIEVDE